MILELSYMSISLYVRETGKVWAIIPAKTYYGRCSLLHVTRARTDIKAISTITIAQCVICTQQLYQYEVYVNFFFQSQTMEIILYLHELCYCCPLKRPVSLYEYKNYHGITTSAFTHSGNNESSGLYNYACRMGSVSKLVIGPLFNMLK